ncbi:ribosomal RNA small subunit methyltransferase NEP1 isoform X2 [Dendrobium catenatum]|uniref:ribosomal RNA small subunit methyltransferase NEP1 isoform X2 n=1 Tax=Dendrobium catenatum TaxID=906689 RepID=UPI00109F2ACD|nr:ribosomal RNA small subunit methyltransferase NEP1 isoform X2 [Dendrobium catenatum]
MENSRLTILFFSSASCVRIRKIAVKAPIAILDSLLTKAGRLRALYVRSTRHALIEVKPHVRVPRTFSAVVRKVKNYCRRQTCEASPLIKNPVTDHLPVNSRKAFVAAASDIVNLVFMVGAMAHGVIDKGFIDDFISVSNYPLSAACWSRNGRYYKSTSSRCDLFLTLGLILNQVYVFRQSLGIFSASDLYKFLL